MTQDWTKLGADLERLLKLRSIPFGMKLFENRDEMEANPRIRRPKAVHTLDQVVAQAARLGWTVGITSEDLVGAQCRAVVGLGLAKDDKWRSGQHMVGVWYNAPEDAQAHQAAMECVPDGRYEALAVAPLASGRLDPPDIALFYATPGAMIYFINGLQWSGYKRFDWSVVGESACADSWGRALKTREPSLSIPCFAERRYGGVLDDEMLMALPPDDIPKGDRRDGGARQERLALSVPAIRHPAGRSRRHGGQLPRPRGVRLPYCRCALGGGRRSTGASAPCGGSARRSSRPRLCPGLSFQGSEIAERHDSDEAFIPAHHRQATDPPTPHLFRHFLDALALETIQHIGGHRLAYGGLSRVQALSCNLHRNIMAGNRPDQAIVFADRERS